MSDQTLESGQSNESGSATTELSQTGGQQTSTVNAEAIAKALQPLLEPWLKDQVTRTLQGEKDRRINKIERRLDTTEGALTRFAELVGGGMKIEQAQQQLKLESALEYIDSLRQQPEQGGGSDKASTQGSAGATQAVEEAAQLLKDAGLDSDPEWVSMVGKGFPSSHEAVKAAANLVIRRTVKGQKPNEAATIQPSGGALPKKDLDAEYRKELLAARGKGYDAGRAIRQKYRELGLDV